MIAIEMDYSVKQFNTGVSRVFINASHLLKKMGLVAGTKLGVRRGHHRIEIFADPNGKKSVMDTGRGELVELRDRATGAALNGLSMVKVRFEKDRLVISAKSSEIAKMSRERSLLANVRSGVVTKGSLFSGIGYTALKIARGLESQGFRTEMRFANELDPLAMTVQLEANPLWQGINQNATAVCSDIRDIELGALSEVNFVEVGYSCQGQSKLSPLERRDLSHPEVGTLFIPTIAVLRALNPALILIENTEAFINSQTLDLIKRELKGYRFESTVVNGNDWGDFEGRPRACIVAVSDGLPPINLECLRPPAAVTRQPIRTVFDETVDDSAWSVKPHIAKKIQDKRLNFKHNVYQGHETKIASLIAGYQSPKIGSPFVAHPSFETTGLLRPFSVAEHARIRELPTKMFDVITAIASGRHPMVSTRGSKSAAHRLLGNCPSPKAWLGVGAFIGQYFSSLIQSFGAKADWCLSTGLVEGKVF